MTVKDTRDRIKALEEAQQEFNDRLGFLENWVSNRERSQERLQQYGWDDPLVRKVWELSENDPTEVTDG